MNTSITANEPRVPRILVVDDTADNLFLMNGLFEDRYEVIQAASGRDGLKVIMSANPPDMVLLDIMMPDMDGYEVLRRIRQHPPTANIPVIFVTALATTADEKLGINLGAVDYLTKPIDPDMVIQRVEAHVRATAHARNMEGLSEKLARHLAPDSWQNLFHGAELEAIRFEEKQVTVLYADAPDMADWSDRDRDSFLAEMGWLATRHHGTIDRFEFGGFVVFFDEPVPCVRMAMDLQRSAAEMHLRVGVHTGLSVIGTFRSDHEVRCTLLGLETGLAAKVAAAAATGSIVISPETYALVQKDVHADTSACLVTEEFVDSDLAQAQLTPAPNKGSSALSTFAGLGLSN